MRTAIHLTALVLMAALAFTASGNTVFGGTTKKSETAITARIMSGTNITASACSTDRKTFHFGTIIPGQPYTTTGDCSITFGSSNDTSMLRLFQTDRGDDAMWMPGTGSLDNAFSADGFDIVDMNAGGVDVLKSMDVDDDQKIVFAGDYKQCWFDNNDLTVGRLNENGGFDTTFNNPTGYRIINPGASCFAGQTVHALPGNGIIVTASYGNELYAYKFEADGDYDNTFSADGVFSWGFSATEEAIDSFVMDDGRIVVLGRTGADGSAETTISRLMPDGTLDEEFDTDGKVTITDGTADTICRSVTVEKTTNDIICAGVYNTGSEDDVMVLRLNPDGSRDTGFAPSGLKQIEVVNDNFYEQAFTVLIDQGGKYVVNVKRNPAEEETWILRLNTDGTYDTTFNGSGIKSVTRLADYGDHIYDTVQLPDGRYVAAGTGSLFFSSGAIAYRLNNDGTMDSSFSDDGRISYESVIGTWDVYEGINSIGLGSDGRIMFVGNAEDSVNGDSETLVGAIDASTLPDYVETTSDWNDGANGMFGTCLRTVTGAGASAVWNTNATCPQIDANYWYGVPDHSGSANAKIAQSTNTGQQSAVANLRFGIRTSATQDTGTFQAPITFEVVAPNA